MKREDFSWTKFSHENVTTISRIEAIRKIIDQEVGLESCQPGIAEIEKRYDDLYHDYIDGKLKHRELYNLAQTVLNKIQHQTKPLSFSQAVPCLAFSELQRIQLLMQ